MFHILELCGFIFAAADWNACAVAQNEVFAVHALDGVHVDKNPMIALQKSGVVFEQVENFFVSHCSGKFFARHVNAEAMPLVNVDVANVPVGDGNFAAFDWNGQPLLIVD